VLLLSVWPAYGEVSWELPPLPSPSSSLSIDYAADSADGWSRQLAASLPGPMQLRFDLAYGESYVSADTAELKTGFRAFGIATDPLAVIGTDLSYERWGRDDELTIDTLRLGLRLDLGDFAFSLMPQQRSIRLFARERFRNILPYVDVDSQDLGFSLGYYGLADWALSAEYFHYGYSEDLSRLADNFLALFVFPLETLELASGLNARHLTLGATRFLSAGEIGFEWLRAASAVDGSIATVGTLHGSVDLSPAWQLNLRGGVQNVDYSADSILFLGMGIGYRG
jgi:hypothetical protein